MNLADLCPEGVDLWAEMQHFDSILYSRSLLLSEQREYAEADQTYQEHVRDCELYGGENG